MGSRRQKTLVSAPETKQERFLSEKQSNYLYEKGLLQEMPISGQVSRASGRESTNQKAFLTTRKNMEPRHIASEPLK